MNDNKYQNQILLAQSQQTQQQAAAAMAIPQANLLGVN
jgi:hypothetical protein